MYIHFNTYVLIHYNPPLETNHLHYIQDSNINMNMLLFIINVILCIITCITKFIDLALKT